MRIRKNRDIKMPDYDAFIPEPGYYVREYEFSGYQSEIFDTIEGARQKLRELFWANERNYNKHYKIFYKDERNIIHEI